MDATSSSVISDLIDAAHALRGVPRNSGFVPHGLYGRTLPIEETVSEFYLRIHVNDEPGVIAGVAGILAGNAIGIGAMSSLPPGEMPGGKFSEVILTTHEARYGVVQRALAEISELPYVTRPPVCLRIETL